MNATKIILQFLEPVVEAVCAPFSHSLPLFVRVILRLLARQPDEKDTIQEAADEADAVQVPANLEPMVKMVQEPTDAQFQDTDVSEVEGNRFCVDTMDPSTLQVIQFLQREMLRPLPGSESPHHRHFLDSFRHVDVVNSTISQVEGDQYDVGKRPPKASQATPEHAPTMPSMGSRLRQCNNCIIEETCGNQVTIHRPQ